MFHCISVPYVRHIELQTFAICYAYFLAFWCLKLDKDCTLVWCSLSGCSTNWWAENCSSIVKRSTNTYTPSVFVFTVFLFFSFICVNHRGGCVDMQTLVLADITSKFFFFLTTYSKNTACLAVAGWWSELILPLRGLVQVLANHPLSKMLNP